MESVVPQLQRVAGAFPLARTERALAPTVLVELDRRFAQVRDWARHDQHFYQCFIHEVTDWPEGHGRALREVVAEALGLPLAGRVGITLQRMEVGDGAAPHTDAPRAGYEAARLVVQLDTPGGGRFRALEQGEGWLELAPVRNHGVAFELGPRSWHEVTACEGPRRTVVFHFWHPANPEHTRARLDATVGTLSFADLPSVLDASIERADALDPERTDRAAQVAWWLRRWGHAHEALVAAFDRAVDERPPQGSDEALACFLAVLHREGFDRLAYEALPEPARERWRSVLAGA